MLRELLEDSIAVKQRLLNDDSFWKELDRVIDCAATALLQGNKIMIAGNGGSAADAQHFAAEIVATLEKEKRRGYPAMALTVDTSFLTAWINDFGPDKVFARQVEAFGKPGDVLLGISTSGNSKNVILAVEQAKQMDVHTVGLLGNQGGALKGVCDMALIVPSPVTARIQESHVWMIHAICKGIVERLPRNEE